MSKLHDTSQVKNNYLLMHEIKQFTDKFWTVVFDMASNKDREFKLLLSIIIKEKNKLQYHKIAYKNLYTIARSKKK